MDTAGEKMRERETGIDRKTEGGRERESEHRCA